MKNAEFVRKDGSFLLLLKHTTLFEISSLLKRCPVLDACDVFIRNENNENDEDVT